MIKQSKIYEKDDFTRSGRSIYQLKSKEKDVTYRLDMSKRTCECSCYLKWGACHHLAAYDFIFDEFVQKEKRGRKGAPKKATKALKL